MVNAYSAVSRLFGLGFFPNYTTLNVHSSLGRYSDIDEPSPVSKQALLGKLRL